MSAGRDSAEKVLGTNNLFFFRRLKGVDKLTQSRIIGHCLVPVSYPLEGLCLDR